MTELTGDVSELQSKVDRLGVELRALTERLDQSERVHRRRFRLAGAGAFVALVLVMAGGAAFVQQFARLDVIGPNNDVRVSVSVDPVSGSAGLEVFGVNGRKAVFLGTSRDGLPNLAMYDPTGQRIIREIAP